MGFKGNYFIDSLFFSLTKQKNISTLPSFLFFFFWLFLFIYSLGTNSSSLLTTCLQSCGSLIIRYPFWVHNKIESTSDQQYYGYPGFGVMCQNGEAILGLYGDWYRAKEINYANYSLTLLDIDVTTNQMCPRSRQNISLERLHFFFFF